MRRHIKPFLLGLAGAATAWALSLPAYHHLFALARVDCPGCLVTIANNTAAIARAQAADVTSEAR